MLAGLLPQLGHLTLGLLADRLGADQLLALLTRLVDDLLGLLAGLGDELLLLVQQLLGLGELGRQGLAHGIHRFNGVLLIHQTAAAEGNARAVQHDFLQLVQLIEHGAELRLGHHRCSGDSRLKNAARSCATPWGTM